MTFKIQSTQDAARQQGVNILVHGPAGAGKTRLCATLPAPLIISAESGLLSLADYDLPVITVNSLEDVTEAYNFLTRSEEATRYQSVAIDSLTEVAEVCLSHEKAVEVNGKFVDPRQAYGALIDKMTLIVRAFRDLPNKHVYMAAQQERIQIDAALIHGISFPGKQLTTSLPYMFDELFALRVETNPEGKIVRYLQTSRDSQYDAKDRSGKLAQFEEPHLGNIINKIINKKDD